MEPTPSFTADVVSGRIPLTVSFTDTSTGVPTSWDWNFGDGSSHSTLQNPTHVYTDAGLYTISFTATNVDGSAATGSINYISATDNDYRDLPATINIRDFRMVMGTPALTTDRLGVTIPFTGIADPALTADLLAYEYSTDNGSNWSTMTTASTLTGLAFTPSGAAFSIVWDATTDVSTLLYNTQLRIRLKAESGSYETAYSSYILFFERTIVNTQLRTSPGFPADYRGIPGSDLMANAPKA